MWLLFRINTQKNLKFRNFQKIFRAFIHVFYDVYLFIIFSTPVQCTKNSVVYEIISSLPLPAENSTLDSGADDLGPGFELGQVGLVWPLDPEMGNWKPIQATMAANTAREKIKSSSDEDKWDPNSAFDRYVKVCNSTYT